MDQLNGFVARAFQVKPPTGTVPANNEGTWVVQVCEPRGPFNCGRAQAVAQFTDSKIGIDAETLAKALVQGINARTEP